MSAPPLARATIRNGETVLSTEVDGVPVDVVLGPAGVRISSDEIQRTRDRVADQVRRAEEARQRAQDAAATANPPTSFDSVFAPGAPPPEPVPNR